MIDFSACTEARLGCAITRCLNRRSPVRASFYSYYSENPDLIEMAALYTAGIVRNHPFVDGNKRTGFVVGVLFLEINGYVFSAREEDATQAVVGIAAGKIEEPAFAAWLRANVKASE